MYSQLSSRRTPLIWDRQKVLVSILERCPSYKESNKGNKQRQGPTLGVRFTEVSVKRESTVNLDNSNLPEILLSFCAIDVYANSEIRLIL